jgi:hypothetical protein
MVEQMTNLIELNRDQIEQLVRDELDFLIDYEFKSNNPDVELVAALRLVRKQFIPFGELQA